MGTHIDAYLLSEILRSPRFGNAVMEKILDSMSARKYDEDLKDIFRLLFERSSSSSPLFKLFFDACIYWKLELGGGGSSTPKSFRSEGLLGLDPNRDEDLISALKRYKDKFCECSSKQQPCRRTATQAPYRLSNVSTRKCPCGEAPWNKREKFFSSG